MRDPASRTRTGWTIHAMDGRMEFMLPTNGDKPRHMPSPPDRWRSGSISMRSTGRDSWGDTAGRPRRARNERGRTGPVH